MKQNKYRIIKGVLIAIAACGVCTYNTVHRNNLDYQVHPAASILGSIIPGIIAGFASYWWDGWRAKRNQGEPFPFAKACFVLLALILLILVIFAGAILAAIPGAKTISKNVNANEVGVNPAKEMQSNGNEKPQVASNLEVFDLSLFTCQRTVKTSQGGSNENQPF